MANRKRKPEKIEPLQFLRTKVIFVQAGEDRDLLRKLANSCRETAELYRRYQSLPQIAIGTLFQDQAWSASNEAATGEPPTMKVELPSDGGHLSPTHLFSEIILRAFPDGFDPDKFKKLTFDSLLMEMGDLCERFARRRRGAPRNLSLHWLIRYIREKYWKGEKGLGVNVNPDTGHYEGRFLDLMEEVLTAISYRKISRDALAQAILTVLKRRKQSDSLR